MDTEAKVAVLLTATAAVLTILKLAHVIAWSWVFVLFPLWFPLATFAAAMLAFALIVIVFAIFPTEKL